MLTSSLNYEAISKDDLRQYEDKYFSEMTTGWEQHDVIVSELTKLIDECLSKKNEDWLKTLCCIVESSAYQAVKNHNEKFLILDKIYHLCDKKESYKNVQELQKVSSINESFELYYRTVFLLRRFEYRLPEELCRDILVFIEKWSISPEFVLMILESEAIFDWNAAGDRLYNFLVHNGYMEYGKIIFDWMLKKFTEDC